MREKISGPEKAAILLLTMGEQFATQIIQNLENHEIQRLGAYMSKTADCSTDDVEEVIKEYHQKAVSSEGGLPFCDLNFVHRLIRSSIGEERARPILEKLSSASCEVDLSFVRDIDPKNLVNFIKMEHPQTIALVFSYMTPNQSSDALALLPEHLQGEVLMRIAGLEAVDATMVEDIANVLEREVKVAGGTGTTIRKVSGLQTAAEIMNNMDKSITGEIFNSMQEKDQALVERIRERMFVFDDIMMLDDKCVQTVLKNIDNNQLIVALKTASNEIKEKIRTNMSKRAAQRINEEMEVMGPIRLSMVEQAQREIAAVARKLEEANEITLSRTEGDIVV
jgi:flagellar motor switch protein FliG